ncbi:MAG: DUF6984 family protein [Niveispirillum sp.]|uniref:DUF6984 family protein n=1 Tax=Niveispirillum sp. TaxID=1917217 RepID=UPI004035BE81
MRDLSPDEMSIVLRLADSLPEPARSRLISDAAAARVVEERADGECLIFSISGYQRPPYRGQELYPAEGRIIDADGAEIDVLLYMDAQDRLLELEYIRWGDGPILTSCLAERMVVRTVSAEDRLASMM